MQNTDRSMLSEISSQHFDIQNTDHPDREMQMAAVRTDFHNIRFISNPDEEVQLYVFEQDRTVAFHEIDNMTPLVFKLCYDYDDDRERRRQLFQKYGDRLDRSMIFRHRSTGKTYRGNEVTVSRNDGDFVWQKLSGKEAMLLFDHSEIYRLYPDGSEGLIESREDLMQAVRSNCTLGKELGFIRDFTADFEFNDVISRRSIARYGNEQDRDRLINDRDWIVRSAVARYGNDRQRSLLINDEQREVRMTVAQYGNDRHRDALVNDGSDYVRSAVAMFGSDSQRDRLLHDDNPTVRSTIAMYGNAKQQKFLLNDKFVSQTVRSSLRKKGYKIISRLMVRENEDGTVASTRKILFGNRELDLESCSITDLSNGKIFPLKTDIDLFSLSLADVQALLLGKSVRTEHGSVSLSLTPKGYVIENDKVTGNSVSSEMEPDSPTA